VSLCEIAYLLVFLFACEQDVRQQDVSSPRLGPWAASFSGEGRGRKGGRGKPRAKEGTADSVFDDDFDLGTRQSGGSGGSGFGENGSISVSEGFGRVGTGGGGGGSMESLAFSDTDQLPLARGENAEKVREAIRKRESETKKWIAGRGRFGADGGDAHRGQPELVTAAAVVFDEDDSLFGVTSGSSGNRYDTVKMLLEKEKRESKEKKKERMQQ
jgi:hypothetical protein